ncbi:MAG: hypothetical protein GW949_07360 [Spirochaetales bacterium]|nr:hypothetical protein [Spirochaetales bacterium]
MINLRLITLGLLLSAVFGSVLVAGSPEDYVNQVSVEFSPQKIDGYVAYRARAVYESNISTATLMDRLAQGNLQRNPDHPRMMEVRVLDSWDGGFRVYQKYGVKIIFFTDSTEMILDFDTQWQGSTGVFAWHITESPDGKMVDSRGSWTIRPSSGSNIHQGPSILEYEVTTIFNRTDYVFEQLVETFGRGELVNTLKYISRSLL